MPGQVRCVLAAAGGPVTAAAISPPGIGLAADPGAGEFGVELGQDLIQPGRFLTVGLVAEFLDLGALLEQPGLPVIRRGR